MSGPDFLDTNVFVYAYDHSHPAKQAVAQELVRKAMMGEVLTSTQVLAEFAATLLHKLNPPMPASHLISILETLAPIRTILADREIVCRAVQARDRYGVHFYDGMILAAAERAGCSRIWSEDLNPKQKYFGVVVQNPFA